MHDSEIAKLIDEVYRPALSRYGYLNVDVKFGTDHRGDPAIFATAHFEDRNDVGLPDGVQAPLLLQIFDRLRASGEERFPYVTHAYPAAAE